MPTRKAHARWEGSLKEGRGQVDFGNGAFKAPYSFTSRFENGMGTNPEELLGAQDGGFKITKSHIVCEARVPGIDSAAFMQHANAAKSGCPVSQALAGTEITLDAKLVAA